MLLVALRYRKEGIRDGLYDFMLYALVLVLVRFIFIIFWVLYLYALCYQVQLHLQAPFLSLTSYQWHKKS